MRSLFGSARGPASIAATLLMVAACGSDGGNATRGGFESDFPTAQDDGRNSAGGDAASAPEAAQDDDGGGAERAIVEADIVQIVGDRLFALSRAAGLSVIDLSNPDKLRLVGSARDLPADPFEMYVRDDVAIIMFSSWGQYVVVDNGYQWVQTSKVIALDVREPAAIEQLGSFDVPGMISDSRIVGDVLYVVGYQDGYCWGCQDGKPLTAIVSLDVKDPREMRKVDELQYADAQNQWGWNRRSVTVTSERMYVAGPEYGTQDVVGSTIQIVDISDPAGDLVEGAAVPAKGMISSRWQMDEHEGVLRVISQPGQWNLDQPPVVQTFTVASSSDVKALGQTELVLPRREALQSVRFDGPRAYAITFERTDPLFTIDLTDPAAPKQVGQLEMPGFVYYMQPRGNRVLGLGFDQGNPEGSITVSIFDVENLAEPKMLDRVNFGGDWGSLPEDQDRIHKAFRIFDELGLILVPFSGWNDSDSKAGCWNVYRSGVQMVDFVGDELTLRAAVPSEGEARRGFVHAGRLFSVGDERVRSFDIADRSAPVAKGDLVLARNVSDALPLDGNVVARINQDWWSERMLVDFVGAGDVELASASLSELDLGKVIGTGDCNGYVYITAAYGRGTQVEVVYQRHSWGSDKSTSTSGVAVIDASDPTKPEIASTLEWDTGDSWWWYDGFYGYGNGYTGNPSAIVRTDSTITMLEARYETRGNESIRKLRARVIDLTDPSKPSQVSIALADQVAYSGLIARGDTVLTSHYVPSDSGRVRFYVDSLDVSDPAQPTFGAPINVPGSLLHDDPASGRVVTTELRRVVTDSLDAEACYKRFANARFEDDNYNDNVSRGRCEGFVQSVHLVRLGSVDSAGAVLEDTLELAEDQMISSSSLGDDRLFATLGHGYGYGYADVAADCFGPCGGYGYGNVKPSELLVLGGLKDGKFEVGRLVVEDANQAWWGFWGAPPVHAQGQRAVLVSNDQAAVVDASDASAPKIVHKQTLHGWLQSVHMDQGSALLSLSTAGVQRVDMQ